MGITKSEGYKDIVYINDRLERKLSSIPDYTLTFIDAPMGYGKTTAIREYAQNSTGRFIWINISNNSKEIFWADFSDAFFNINRDSESSLRIQGYPHSEKSVAEIRSIIKHLQITEATYIVLDNYYLIADEWFEMLIGSLADAMPEELHFIILSQMLKEKPNDNKINKDNINHIGKEDFELTKEDIIQLFKQNNLKISSSDAERLRNTSDGWISVIYLQMINYAENHTLNDSSSIDMLIEKNLWSRINNQEKELLISLSFLEYFTLKEAKMLVEDEYDENRLERFFGALAFVRFEKSDRKYYFNPILTEYLNKEYEHLSKENQRSLITKTGDLYWFRGDIFRAYEFYFKAQQWGIIYSSIPSFDKLYPHINVKNKDFFMSLIHNHPTDAGGKYYYFPIIMCLVLFMYNEKDRIINYLVRIMCAIEESKELSQIDKQELFGTLYFVRGYTEFNKLSSMHSFYKKSMEHAGSTVYDLTSKVPYTFGCPSVFHMYHRTIGAADEEIKALSDMLRDYGVLSGNHGKGADALFKAETLYNRGEITGAETLCHKVLYMSDSAEQICLVMGAFLLLARISIYNGDYDTYKLTLENFRKKVKSINTGMDAEYLNMADMCESFIYVTMNDIEKVAEWLTDYNTIDSRINLISISYANMIYSKYLCISGKYQKFLGISGQILEIDKYYESAYAQIYTYIYIAIANSRAGNKEKSIAILGEAMEMAYKDMLYMPFVENIMHIENILNESKLTAVYRDFIENVKQLSGKYMTGYRTIRKNAADKENFGLTARECDVARLAAQRYSNKEIGAQLFIAESTVKSNLKVVFSKLGISSRSELSKYF